jgi:hypothetical protein
MRDIFYTVVVLWLVYRIWQAFSVGSKASNRTHRKQEGDVTIHNMNDNKSSGKSEGGEYVDYEEVKDNK